MAYLGSYRNLGPTAKYEFCCWYYRLCMRLGDGDEINRLPTLSATVTESLRAAIRTLGIPQDSYLASSKSGSRTSFPAV